ncbi:MAG: ABC transporter permease [Gracilibacteraceae bacterium]|jgi:peptide/nickel transport system permease protein|nr:ABC transporter permease [Gracilibacteraceae bacterium]
MSDFLKKYSRHRLAMAGLIFLFLEVLLALTIPIFLPLDPIAISRSFNAPPDAEHILGTDGVGRDVLARVIYGGRLSLFIGVASVAITVSIGLPLGLIAGYYRGPAESVIMRAAETFLSIPLMVFVLVVVAIVKATAWNVALIIGGLGWPAVAKLIYASVLAESAKEYVEAARVLGRPNHVVAWLEVLPNAISPLWAQIAFRISQAIMIEASLSFLGAGIQPPAASWGNIMYAAQDLAVLTNRLWIWLPPGICLVLTVMSINLVGEGIRDVLDPKMNNN